MADRLHDLISQHEKYGQSEEMKALLDSGLSGERALFDINAELAIMYTNRTSPS